MFELLVPDDYPITTASSAIVVVDLPQAIHIRKMNCERQAKLLPGSNVM
jgi:hypothetical protein